MYIALFRNVPTKSQKKNDEINLLNREKSKIYILETPESYSFAI